MGGITAALGELAFLAMPSLDPAPDAAPQWAKRLRVSFKMWKRGKREAKPEVWTPYRPSYAPTGQDMKRLAMQQQALNNAMYAGHLNALQQSVHAGLQNAVSQQSNSTGLQNQMTRFDISVADWRSITGTR